MPPSHRLPSRSSNTARIESDGNPSWRVRTSTRPSRTRELSRGKRVALEAVGALPSEAGRGPDPQAALAVRDEAADGVVDEAVLLRVAGEAAFVQAVQPIAVGADPQVAVRVFGQGADGR